MPRLNFGLSFHAVRTLEAFLASAALLGLAACGTAPDEDEHVRPSRTETGGAASGTGATGGASGDGTGAMTASGGTAAGGTGGTTNVAVTGALAVPALEAVGIEWRPVEGATHYNVYWATTPGVTPATGTLLGEVQRNLIHDQLTDGTTYYYVVTAVVGGVESPPSAEVSATPGGEYGLRHFGNGDMPDLLGSGGAWVPLEKRVQVLILGDGYLAGEMPSYLEDVDEYIDDVLTKDIYAELREAFVFWSMPVVSEGRVGNGSAWAIDAQPRHTSDTTARIWAAVRNMPYAPTEYFTGQGREPKNVVVGMMATDSGNSEFSGYMTTLNEPNVSPTTRLRVGFFHGRAHEFSHAFAYLSDEYFEIDHTSSSSSESSNIHDSASCDSLPWAHLLYGGEYNPGVDQLVGAFGEREGDPRLDGTGVTSDLTRVHSELKCHINGSHDNALLYGGNNLLRAEDRFCNWCRELIAFAAFERTGVLEAATAWDTWKGSYRSGFYDVIGFSTPSVVPQQNSLGEAKFDACEP